MFKTFSDDKESTQGFGETFQELYFDAIEQMQDTDDYKRNQEKIRQIKSQIMLGLHIKDEVMIDKLISTVIESVESEYEFANEHIISYIDNNIPQIAVS